MTLGQRYQAALFLGGVRSGKSRMAQAWVTAHAAPWTYLATCRHEARDAEMSARIARHVADRADHGWITVEEALDPARALRCSTTPVLLDCATLWLTNLGEHLAWQESAILERVDELCVVLQAPPVPVAMVSNEVGMGIVPDHPLGRVFRDLQGHANQRLAAACQQVTFCVAGLPISLKGA